MAPVTVLTWNLFHGRAQPAADRVLRSEFAAALAAQRWDVALLQEAPWHWLRPLARECGAAGASTLTSRNFGSFLRRVIANRAPDLIKSSEGGSNQILVRGGWRLRDVRRSTLTLWPERRRMIWARLEHPAAGALTVSSLHASADDRPAAADDVVRAARAACSWSAELPLVFGGDFNLRMSETPQAFELLEAEFGLAGARPGRAIDHLLARAARVLAPPEPLPPGSREQGLPPVRLSDHDPVVATYDLRSALNTNGGD